jgi:hypothetical protein
MAEGEHDYRDPHEVIVRIRPSREQPSVAYVQMVLQEPGFGVPAHRLAEFTRALYAAAGQPVPDLPVIYDPATVGELAADLADALGPPFPPYPDNDTVARRLLDAGWRKP